MKPLKMAEPPEARHVQKGNHFRSLSGFSAPTATRTAAHNSQPQQPAHPQQHASASAARLSLSKERRAYTSPQKLIQPVDAALIFLPKKREERG